MMGFKLSEKSKENRAGIDDRLIEISDLAISLTLIDFGHGPFSGLRNESEQHYLFTEGKSKADGIVKMSNHQIGKALDFYAYIDGEASWKQEHLAMVACAFLQAASILGHKVSWGGLWYSGKGFYGWDMAHIELLD